jgi:pimeloyl-ACP methyl ester carboxylesterase
MANLAAHLARRGPVIVPDLRGRGESDQPEDGYDPGTMAADVAALIEALALDRPVVIGRLHGGLVAYHLAARRPELVRGVVLGDTAPEVGEVRAAAARAATAALPERFASLDAALAFYQDGLGLAAARARHDIPHDLVAVEGGGYRWRYDLGIIDRIEAAVMPRADWDLLARIECPVLLLRGQRGEVPPPMAARFCEVVAGCRVQTVYGARHDVFLGPGAEQAFGAVELFLMRFGADPAIGAAADRMPLGADGAALGAAPDQLPLPGAEPPAATTDASGSAAALLDRVVRAINGRDEVAVAALFAPDGRFTQYRPGGKARDGGVDAAQAAFGDLFADQPGGVVTARDLVTSAAGDQAAAVLVLRAADPEAPAAPPSATAGGDDPVPDDAPAVLAPIFFRLSGDRIARFVSYGLRLPADDV